MCNICLCGFFVFLCVLLHINSSVFLQLTLVVSSLYVLLGDGWDGHVIGCHPSSRTSGSLTAFSTYFLYICHSFPIVPRLFDPLLVSCSLQTISHHLHLASSSILLTCLLSIPPSALSHGSLPFPLVCSEFYSFRKKKSESRFRKTPPTVISLGTSVLI